MIFRLTQKDIREDNDNIDIVPEFAKCTSRELKYISLVYDYDTPLFQLLPDDRKEQAAEMAGYQRESAKRMDKSARIVMNGERASVQAAVPVFKGMQRDLDKETLMAFDRQIQQFINKTGEDKKDNKDWDTSIKILKELPKLLSMRKEIKELLGHRGDLDKTLGHEMNAEVGEELSALDKRNQEMVDKKTKNES